MIVREFNSAGIVACKSFLAQSRIHPQMPFPRGLLEDDSLTKRLFAELTVEPTHFGRRREAADYLATLLAPLPEDEIAQNSGLWTWLSMFFFNEVCPFAQGNEPFATTTRTCSQLRTRGVSIVTYCSSRGMPLDSRSPTNVYS